MKNNFTEKYCASRIKKSLNRYEMSLFFIAFPLDFSAASAKIIFHIELFSISLDSDMKKVMESVPADPFYSESNMRCLNDVISKIENGTAVMIEHDIIEE